MWPFKEKSARAGWVELGKDADRECHKKTSVWLEVMGYNRRLTGNNFIRRRMIAEGIKFPCYDRFKEHPLSKKSDEFARQEAKRWMERKDQMRQEINKNQQREIII